MVVFCEQYIYKFHTSNQKSKLVQYPGDLSIIHPQNESAMNDRTKPPPPKLSLSLPHPFFQIGLKIS